MWYPQAPVSLDSSSMMHAATHVWEKSLTKNFVGYAHPMKIFYSKIYYTNFFNTHISWIAVHSRDQKCLFHFCYIGIFFKNEMDFTVWLLFNYWAYNVQVLNSYGTERKQYQPWNGMKWNGNSINHGMAWNGNRTLTFWCLLLHLYRSCTHFKGTTM